MFRHAVRRAALASSIIAAPRVDEIVASSGRPTRGWAKVYEIFSVDEFGSVSPQLNTILQTTFATVFFGGCYGGFIQSREAYLRFFERNQATRFTDQFDAKKKLQDTVTINFAKGAVKWSWRLALFGGFYITFVTVLGAYFGELKVWHFSVSGLLSGAIYRINMGLMGMVAGGTLGTLIGLLAGSLTVLTLRLTGSSLDDIQKLHTELAEARARRPPSVVEDREFLMTHEELLKRDEPANVKNETSPAA